MKPKPPPTFAARLRSLREAAGLNRNQLAIAAGLDPAFVYQIEDGKKQPSLETARKLAAALGKSLAEFD